MEKKLALINVVCNGSTGRIMTDLATYCEGKNYKVKCFYGRGNSNNTIDCIKIGSRLSFYYHVLLTRLFNKHGHGSYFNTKKLVKYLKKFDPDIIHLHNIHGYYLNLKVLFEYLSTCNKKIIWTLHDCWTFTGHCSHFTAQNCDKWQMLCNECQQVNVYPKSLIVDSSKKEYQFKKKIFTNIPNLTIITVSDWLANLVHSSFFKNKEIKIINNGVNLNVFRPTNTIDIFKKYRIPSNKKIILGVANIWDNRKGLNIFYDLARIIKKENIIVLVGLNDKQLNKLPSNIIGIKRTDNIEDLVNLYSVASVFVNPSLEETFSMVTVEAMACGTPVVVCNTSAIKELIISNTGYIIDKQEAINYYEKCQKILKKDKSYYLKHLLEHVQKYENEKSLEKYIHIYEE